jgi:hypothetical protein
MIKNIILAAMVLMLAVTISLASEPQGIHEPGTGIANPELKEASQGTGQGLESANETNASASTPGIHEPGTGIANPELKEAAQATGQGNKAQSAQSAETPAPEAQSGFDAVLALMGLIAVAFIAVGRRN